MSNPYDLVVLADSPVSYWPLDDPTGTTATDLAGSNPGSYQGTGGTNYHLGQSGPSSNFGGAVSFDGSAGYVSVPDATNLRITGPITLEGWVFYTGLSTGSTNFPTLVQKYDGTTNGYALLNQPHDGGGLQDKPICYLFKSGSLSFENSPNVMTTGGWHHIVATYDNVNPLIVYVDGVAVVSGNIGANKLGSNTSPLLISNYNQSGDNGFVNGKLAGIAVYNAVLTPAQVLKHYQVGVNAIIFVDGLGTAPVGLSVSSLATVLTTVESNDIIVVPIYLQNTSNSVAQTVTGVSGGSLTWALRKAINDATGFTRLEEWWAYAASPLSGTTITASFSGSVAACAIASFGVSGAVNFTAPWDVNASLPATVIGTTGIPSATGVSTTGAHDLLIALGANPSGTPTNLIAPSGFTLLAKPSTNSGGAAGMADCVESVTAVLSSATITWGASMNGPVLMIVDALTADSTLGGLFRQANLATGAGGPFFVNPIG